METETGRRLFLKEVVGAEYIIALRHLLEIIPEHRGMTNAYLHGNTSFESQILQRRKKSTNGSQCPCADANWPVAGHHHKIAGYQIRMGRTAEPAFSLAPKMPCPAQYTDKNIHALMSFHGEILPMQLDPS